MRCRQCKQPGSPINKLLIRLETVDSVNVLSACSGYTYKGHVNLPNRPFILFSVKHLGTVESLWRQVFSNLIVPGVLIYNGSRQFLFELDVPLEWPDRTDLLTSVWSKLDERMKEIK